MFYLLLRPSQHLGSSRDEKLAVERNVFSKKSKQSRTFCNKTQVYVERFSFMCGEAFKVVGERHAHFRTGLICLISGLTRNKKKKKNKNKKKQKKKQKKKKKKKKKKH